MKKISLDTVRRIVRETLEEMMDEEEETVATAKTQPAPATHSQAVAKTMPSPGLSVKGGTVANPSPQQPANPQAIGSRDAGQIAANQSKPTVPAAASHVQRAFDQSLKGKNQAAPRQGMTPNSMVGRGDPNTQKAGMIANALQKRGIQTPDTGPIKQWLSQMDPGDAMIKTADQLADAYHAQSGGQTKTG